MFYGNFRGGYPPLNGKFWRTINKYWAYSLALKLRIGHTYKKVLVFFMEKKIDEQDVRSSGYGESIFAHL
jgi:hypothetical protein